MSFTKTVKKFFHEGLKDEEFVIDLTKEKWGGFVRKATPKEDRNDHIDFFWKPTLDAEEIGFDVKGLRKNNRNDTEFDDSITWIELMNVQGKEGSVYGKAKYLAFITNKSVVYVPREELVEFVNKKIRGKELVNICPKDCYIPYTRKGRHDIIVKTNINDLREFAKQEIIFTDDLEESRC